MLPADFAESLARVVDPRDRSAVAGVIEAAMRLDDEGLRIFLDRFAARVRASAAPITHDELRQFLRAADAT
jgi:hypothetical protein